MKIAMLIAVIVCWLDAAISTFFTLRIWLRVKKNKVTQKSFNQSIRSLSDEDFERVIQSLRDIRTKAE